MAEQSDKNDKAKGESIDYGASQKEIDAEKQKARDEDAERLAEESK